MWHEPRKSPRSPRSLLVDSSYAIWTHGHNPPHNSCGSWSSAWLGAGIYHARHVCMCIAHSKERRSRFTTSWYIFCGNNSVLGIRARSPFSVLLQQLEQQHVCPPLLSLTSLPRPRFCAEDLPKLYWSTLLRGQPSTCSVPQESWLNICSHLSVAFAVDVNKTLARPQLRPLNSEHNLRSPNFPSEERYIWNSVVWKVWLEKLQSSSISNCWYQNCILRPNARMHDFLLPINLCLLQVPTPEVW